MTDTTIGAEEIAAIRKRAENCKYCDVRYIAAPDGIIALCDLASRAIPAAPDVGDEKPAAYMRRCAYEKNEGTRGNRPRGWQYHATSAAKILDDDVPLLEPSQVARIREQARREAYAECLECQPSTAENPNEDAYQRGRFDGVMEFGRNIAAKKAIEALAEAKS